MNAPDLITVTKCKECIHWSSSPVGNTILRRCLSKKADQQYADSMGSPIIGTFLTGPEFGCIHAKSHTREFKNQRGRRQGYGGCERCGDTWDWKASHSTEVTDDYGVFPLCEACWAELDVKTRLPFYQNLITRWGHESEKWKEIEKAVREGK